MPLPAGMKRGREEEYEKSVEYEEDEETKTLRRNAKKSKLKTLSDSRLKGLFSLAIAIELQLALWGLSPDDAQSDYDDCCIELMRVYKNFRDMGASKKTYTDHYKIFKEYAELLANKYGLKADSSKEKKDLTEQLQKIFNDHKYDTALGRFKFEYGDRIKDDKAKKAIKDAVNSVCKGFWKTAVDTTKKVLKYTAYTAVGLVVLAEALDL